MTWLAPLIEALDRASKPVTVFFRDDDAGWANERLLALLAQFHDHDMPIDLAVIPKALDGPLATALSSRIAQQPHRLGLHQHGFAHVNHEQTGRKCEFGVSRHLAEQYADLAAGQAMLQQHLGSSLDPIFTPPWNRLTQTTIDCLHELGFRVLSRDATATPLQLNGLVELKVTVDWCKVRRADGSLHTLAKQIADSIASGDRAGIMLHHAVMDEGDMRDIAALLALLASHCNVRTSLMRDLIGKDELPLAGQPTTQSQPATNARATSASTV